MSAPHTIQAPTGAQEVLLECQEILAGKRRHLTPDWVYVARRRRYWERRAEAGERDRLLTGQAA